MRSQTQFNGTKSTWSVWNLAAVGAVVIGAYLIGNQGVMNFADAATEGDNDERIIISETKVPAARLRNKKELVVIGAADGGLYLVDYNGVATPVEERRRHLLWRDF